MLRRSRGLPVFVLAALLLVGCTTQPTAPGKPDVPILYETPIDPREEMPPEQVREILDLVAPLKPKGQRVWYLFITYGYTREHHIVVYETTVFFSPDETKPRVRSGEFLNIPPANWPWTHRPHHSDEGPAVARKRDVESLKASMRRYWQVAPKGRTFPDNRSVPSGDLSPFYTPADLTENEIVEVADFIGRGREGVTVSGIRRRLHPDKHIEAIWREKDGAIVVNTAKLNAMEDGDRITLRKDGKGITVLEILLGPID